MTVDACVGVFSAYSEYIYFGIRFKTESVSNVHNTYKLTNDLSSQTKANSVVLHK